MHKKQLFGVMALICILAVFWFWTQGQRYTPEMEERFVITALPVGDADALIVQEGDNVIVVDTGEEEDGPYVAQELKNRGISQIDLLLVTHFDKDHVGGAAYLIKNMEVTSVMMPEYEGERPEYLAFLDSLKGHSDVKRLSEPTAFSVGEMEIRVYPAEDAVEIMDIDKDKEYDNDMSLVTGITYGTERFLLTGDIEKTRIRQMLASDVDWKYDWIKMPHHGRYQKALKELLRAVQPSAAVISCSRQEPAEEKTLEFLKEQGIPVWDTSEQTVVTVSDGEQTEVRYK